jgi:hypothetical protein
MERGIAVKPRWPLAAVGIVILTVNQSCVALGISLLAVGAGTAAGQGISYNVNSIAYRTFTVPIEGLEVATLKSLRRMEISVRSRENTDEGVTILAEAGNRDIDIDLDRLTGQTSRMRVNVKQGWFLKDQATATEIIAQTTKTLDGQARTDQPTRSLNPAAMQIPLARPANQAGRPD